VSKSSDLLIFTTSYNERENIGQLIDQIAETVPAADILVVDDNSPDGTWDVIQQKAERWPQLRAVMRPRKMGIGSAHKYALLYAMREGYETLVTLDADFSHDPKYIPALLQAHSKNVFVTGSRYCRGGSCAYTGYRRVVSQIGNFAARWVLSLQLKELTTYFRVFDVNSLRRLPLRHINAAGYSYGVQLIYYLRKAGVELREVPIHFADRKGGLSKIPRMQIVVSAVDLLVLGLRRLNPFRDLKPDKAIDHACPVCHDLALAAAPATLVCLRCGSEPSSPKPALATVISDRSDNKMWTGRSARHA
jgi:dolichol-phosphate mannosyltransferase